MPNISVNQIEPTLEPEASPIVPPEEFAAKWEMERRWLVENSQEYAGRWVALDGDHLLGAGFSAREVYDSLKAAGISGSLVTRVEHPAKFDASQN